MIVSQVFNKCLQGLFLLALLTYIFFYYTRYDHFLDWELTTSAESIGFTADTFEKGVFEIKIPGQKYLLEENFSGGAIVTPQRLIYPLQIFSWIGFACLLACVSLMPRVTFLVFNALLIAVVISLNLGYLGNEIPFPSQILNAAIILLLGGLGYFFHSSPRIPFVYRFLSFAAIIVSIGLTITFFVPDFSTFLLAASNLSFSAVTLLFLFLVSEEIIFLVLFVITRSTGKNNEKHFSLLSLIYLGFVLLYFLKKAGIYPNSLSLIDPFLLLAISGMISLWTLPFKQEYLKPLLGELDVRILLSALGIVAFSYLSIGFASGNDPVYESYHYLIVYGHLAFGTIFFLYIIMNFVDGLIAGHAIHRIAYKERNFPYPTARLVGLVGFLAFFFMSNKEPLELTQAATFNFLGQYALQEGETNLAKEFFTEGSNYGYNNHYSNYQLAKMAEQIGDRREAFARYKQSTVRYPTPQAFVNTALFSSDNNRTEPITLLRNANQAFPNSIEIRNNLANLLGEIGKYSEASTHLSLEQNISWNQSPLVNGLKLEEISGSNSKKISPDLYINGNNAVRTNLLSYGLKKDSEFNWAVDTLHLENPYDLHEITLLINMSYASPFLIPPRLYQMAIASTTYGGLQEDVKLAGTFNQYKNGIVSNALLTLEERIATSQGLEKAKLFNYQGLIYLNQHDLRAAYEAFHSATLLNYEPAHLNLIVSLLESHDFRLASNTSEILEKNNGKAPVDFPLLFTQLDTISYPSLYYRWEDFEPKVLQQHISDVRLDTTSIVKIWEKVSKELIQSWDAEKFEAYQKVFLGYLSRSEAERSDFDLMVLKGRPPFHIQESNIYDITGTIATINTLEESNPVAAYHLALEAANSFPVIAKYHEKYIMLALAMGLLDYADQSIQKLKELLEPKAYGQFLERVNARKEQLQSF